MAIITTMTTTLGASDTAALRPVSRAVFGDLAAPEYAHGLSHLVVRKPSASRPDRGSEAERSSAQRRHRLSRLSPRPRGCQV